MKKGEEYERLRKSRIRITPTTKRGRNKNVQVEGDLRCSLLAGEEWGDEWGEWGGMGSSE